MGNELLRQEKFLLEEYNSATKLTYHIDDLRNKVTSFFLALVGIAGVVLTILVKGEASPGIPFFTEDNVAILLFIISLLGGVIVGILGRLRKAQLEHFRIINNIRSYFLGKDLHLWSIVQLSEKTLPMPNHWSGTYYWTFLIISVSSGILAFASYIWIQEFSYSWIITLIVFVVTFLIYDRLYFYISKPPCRQLYSETNIPFCDPGDAK
jgi:hypothetical protein